jgi:predicted  nucleic acid-binding Zn-ribbon protein
MRWFTNLFRQKKTLNEVKTWLSEEQRKQSEEQQQATQSLQNEFPELLNNAREALKALEQAELQNPNIPERAKHYMRGNREQFLKLTERFAENLSVPKEAPDFSQLDLLFHQYAHNSARPAAILSEFFGEEVKEIRKNLAEIETRLHELKQFQLKKEQMEIIAKLIRQIEAIKQEQEETEKQRKELEAQIETAKRKHESIKKEKEAFTSKPEYIKVREDILATAKERQEAENMITTLFLPLSDPIKKYAHKIKNEKIGKYADDPLNALIHDYALSILKHVEDMEEGIRQGTLELKPGRSQKAVDALKQMTRENLSAMIHRYANAKKRETDIHHDVAQRPIMQEYEQYAHELKALNEEIQQLGNTLAKLKPPNEEKTIEELKKELDKYKIVLV